MHEQAILELDRAALTLVQALDSNGAELKPLLEPEHLERLRAEVVNLRRVLLGLEMGILYEDWQIPDELLQLVAGEEQIPVQEAASRVADALSRGQIEGGGT